MTKLKLVVGSCTDVSTTTSTAMNWRRAHFHVIVVVVLTIVVRWKYMRMICGICVDGLRSFLTFVSDCVPFLLLFTLVANVNDNNQCTCHLKKKKNIENNSVL
jgi:hypothetical protein